VSRFVSLITFRLICVNIIYTGAANLAYGSIFNGTITSFQLNII